MPIGPMELVIILLIVMVIFGAKRLPELGGAMGKTIKEFRSSVRELEETVEADNQNT
jgi:sec-independent protein translocase protein TatA